MCPIVVYMCLYTVHMFPVTVLCLVTAHLSHIIISVCIGVCIVLLFIIIIMLLFCNCPLVVWPCLILSQWVSSTSTFVLLLSLWYVIVHMFLVIAYVSFYYIYIYICVCVCVCVRMCVCAGLMHACELLLLLSWCLIWHCFYLYASYKTIYV